jgi:hypothetical protein
MHGFIDDFKGTVGEQIKSTRSILESTDYGLFFTFLEFVCRSPPTSNLPDQIGKILESERSAYRLIDGSIVPVASDADAKNVERAFQALEEERFRGARVHLLTAGRELSAGRWAASVRESIHSVESACRVLAPGSNAVGPALVALEKTGVIHSALKAGFGSLYGYSSDEKGIRHPLLDQGDANVSEADALYMFGACAAFVTYLSTNAPA